MGLPQLETCCWMLDLKTGNIILGCINAIYSFTLFIIMIVTSVVVGRMESDEAAANLGNDTLEEVEYQAALTGVYAMSIILVLMFLIKFCFDIVFLYGVVMERAGIIKAYFIMWTVFFLLSMFTFFLNSPHYNAGTICTVLFYIGLNIYIMLLSHSYYKQLNMREEV